MSVVQVMVAVVLLGATVTVEITGAAAVVLKLAAGLATGGEVDELPPASAEVTR